MEELISQLMANASSNFQRMGDDLTQALVVGLNSEHDAEQMDALIQLCEQLNMATPISINSLNPNALVPPLLNCLQKEYNPELMLLAARALTYMADSLPRSLEIISEDTKNVNVLLTHLRTITDVELSEQCLTCVEKVCQIQSGASALYRAGGITALLSFVDFFTLSSQRKVWETIAVMCKNVTNDSFEQVRESLPAIRSATRNDDAKIRDSAFKALLLAINGVCNMPERVDEIFSDDLIDTLMVVITKADTSDANFTAALGVVHNGVKNSAVVTERVVKCGLCTGIYSLLDAATSTLTVSSSGASPTPESVYSPTSTSPNASAAGKTARLSLDQLRLICTLLSLVLGPYLEGSSAYTSYLELLHPREGTHPSSQQDNNDGHAANTEEVDVDEDVDELEEVDSGGDNEGDSSDAEDPRSAVEEINRQISRGEGIRIVNKYHHRQCTVGNHICDECGKPSLIPGNWYRCNVCSDSDYCARCLLSFWQSHEGGTHNFTDMFAVFHPSQAQMIPQLVRPVEEAKARLYKEQPGLLMTVLTGFTRAVRLCNELEDTKARLQCLKFLISAVHIASAEQLMASHVAESPITETVYASLNDGTLLMQFLGVVLAKNLLTKFPDTYASLLVREGALHHLPVLVKRSPSTGASATAPAKPVNTLQWWRATIASEAAELVSRLSSVANEGSARHLQQLCDMLREGKFPEAFSVLRSALREDVTPFELLSNDVVHELIDALIKKDDINMIVLLVQTLCESEGISSSGSSPLPEKNSALVRLIHHLHTALALLDNFEPLKFGFISSIHSQIQLKLVPHPGTSDAQRSEVSSGNETSAGLTSAAEKTSESTPPQRGRTATVSIEPLANVRAVSTFISAQLIPNSGQTGRRNTTQEDSSDYEGLEEILPELGRSGASEEEEEERPSKARPKHAKPKSPSTPSVWIRMGPHVLPLSMTMLQVLQAIQQHQITESKITRAGRTTSQLVTLHYSERPYGDEYTMLSLYGNMPMGSPSDPVRVLLPSEHSQPPGVASVMARLHFTYPMSQSFLTSAQRDLLTLLGVLYESHCNWAELLTATAVSAAANRSDERVWSLSLAPTQFEHQKLNNKARRHCSNLLTAGQQGQSWAVNLALDCNFLFSASTRSFLFDVSFCGSVRSLVRMQQVLGEYGLRDSSSADHNSLRVYRLQRAKKRVWRDKPLLCAMEVMSRFRTPGSVVLEFEFYGEEGSGHGPTREFYTLVADELRSRALGLWRSSDESNEETSYTSQGGLYPRPLLPESPEADRVVPYFNFLGRFIARCILDEHVPVLELSPVLLKLLRGDACGVYDLCSISTSLGNVLLAMITAKQKGATTISLYSTGKPIPVADMNLDFTVPGDDGVEVIPGGAEVGVTAENMGEYCDRVVGFMLKSGVERAVKAMRKGFHEYIPLIALRMISVEECYERLNGLEQPVSKTELEDNCLADHGYTSSCMHMQWFYEIISSFTLEEQQCFFLFLTGAPHLPVGGLAKLKPKLMVVRKTSADPAVKETDQLPSAMTCQNYLKLPAYESKEQMEAKLRVAMKEGTGAFLLT